MGFAERLQAARKKKGYNQKELSILLGKSKNVISNYENGISKPNLDDFIELSSILDIDPNYLLYDELPDNIKNTINSSQTDFLNGLNTVGIKKVKDYAADLKENSNYRDDSNANNISEKLKQATTISSIKSALSYR